MKFTCSTDINAPRDKVVSIFLNPEKQHHFQDGFISKELLSGTLNTVGAQSKMTYKKLELLETIQINKLPNEFQGLYEHKHTTNTMNVKFIPLSDEKTRYVSEIHYIKFNGFIINLMVKLFPKLFKNQVNKWMFQFKRYVESE
ncbi:SRPBCC family protein [Lacinutrix iliipiscaria]|uniref:SRPBCC family protein n=1 Tax=Lacinutrix iliipiscaria TaxID=1230532 RepID=A0ABW5WU02_9FLAO